ncbi:hypothetical protein [Haloarcula litorea]|uniref:hypothetical protein n=1 Tax=Haloarcula litorea TaxID=3032579 RepID=UPI0023E8A794|nr:hypothetical protein [Halomicroarcula sp. GDY20]
MPRVRTDIADRNRATSGESGAGHGLRLDTDTLAAFGSGGGSTTRTEPPRIVRWLDCWSG